VDTGVVKLSEFDNVSVFAGQNESGKSSILKALYDFERSEFEADSTPFSINGKPTQIISCTYKLDDDDNLSELLTDVVKDEYNLQIEEPEKVLDENNLSKLKEFTITRTRGTDKIVTSIDDKVFNAFRTSILGKPVKSVEGEEPKEEEKYFVVADVENEKVAQLF